MDTKLRPSGIEGLGDMSWGTHFCLFYETKEDLLSVLLRYFKAGLENHEFCLWVTPEPLHPEEVKRAMREAWLEFDQYLAEGQIEIISYTDWYLAGDYFDPQRVLQDWVHKHDQAIAMGYTGLRCTGNTFWLEKHQWDNFVKYEAEIDKVLSELQIIVLCTYSLERSSARDMLAVVSYHQFTVAKRNGVWEYLEGSELKRAHDEIRQLNAELKGRVKERTAQLEAANDQLTGEIAERKQAEDRLRLVIDTIPAMVFTALPDGSVDFVNQRWLQFMGLSLEDVQGWGWDGTIHPEDLARSIDHWRSTMAAGQSAENELRVRRADGAYRWILGRFVPLRDETGNIVKWYGVSTDIDDRKRAEEALRAREQEFRAIVENAPDQIIRYDRNLRRVYVNPAVTKDYGLPKETFIGKPIGSIVADAGLVVDAEEVNAQRRRIQAVFDTGDPIESEVTWPLPDGRRTYWSRLFPEFDSNGEVISVLGIARDITERKRTEDVLRRSEEYLRLVIDTIPIMIWTVRPDGTVDFLNQRWMNYSGLSLEQYVEDPVGPIHPEDRPRVLEKWQANMAAGESYEAEMRLQRADGEYRWFLVRTDPLRDEAGKIVKWYGVSTDIDDRKQAEDVLEETKSNLELILDNSPLPIIGINPEGRITSWNKAAGRVFGWTADEVLGQLCRTIRPEEVEDYLELIRQVMQGETFVGLVRYRQKRDGVLLTCSISLAPQRNGRSEPIGVTAIVEDITERKRAEEALRKSEQVLREAESLGHTGSWEQNLVTGEIFNTEENLRLFFGNDLSKGADLEDYAQVVHPDDREYVLRRRAELLEEEGPGDIEYRVVWPDGSVHVIFGRATVVRNELGQPIRVYGTNVDITERKQAEEHIRQYAARMEALAEISQALAEVGLDIQAVFETIVRHTAELIGDTCGIRLLSSDEQWLKSVAFHNPNPEVKALMRLLHPTAPTSVNDSWLTPVLRTGQPLLIPVITQEQVRRSVQPEYLPFFEQVGLHSMLIVPLRVKGRVIGTLGLSRDNPGHPYTLDDQVLLQDLADRASLTIQNAKLFEQVEGAREQLGALSRRLLEVQESERRVLTSELHDRVGQNLTGLSINIQNMKALLSDEMAKTLATKFDDAQALVQDTTRHIRDIMAELHLPELEDYGLAAALETYAERIASRGNFELIADLPDLPPPHLPSDVRIALFRAAQEAISNVLKHATATQLEVSLEERNGRINLTIEDNGKGFEPDSASQKEAQTWGLKIMRERIEAIGGKVQIESKLGEGTRVTFEIERPS